MKPQRLESFEDWLKTKLRNPRFRKGYARALLAVRLGHRIYQLRQTLGWTQAELARRMGTRQQGVARLERGDYQGFTLKTLQRIARATRTELVIDFRRYGRRAVAP